MRFFERVYLPKTLLLLTDSKMEKEEVQKWYLIYYAPGFKTLARFYVQQLYVRVSRSYRYLISQVTSQ